MIDEETLQPKALPPVILLPSVEGHNMVIAEIPVGFSATVTYYQYQPICSCGFMPLLGPRWYYTKRGATIKANKHLSKVGSEFEDEPEAWDPSEVFG